MKAKLANGVDQDFLVEAGEVLERLGAQLVALESAPGDRELLNAVFRAFHTVKGGAGFLALEPMVLVCHRAEDLLNAARDGAVLLVGPPMDGLLEALDALLGMLRTLAQEAPLQPPSATLLQHLLPPQANASVASVGLTAAAVKPGDPADDSSINDREFEALLDDLYGAGAPGFSDPKLPHADAASRDAASADLADDAHDNTVTSAPRIPPAGLASAAHPEPAVATSDRAPAHSPINAKASVRVDTGRLDALVQRVAELAQVRDRLLKLAARDGSDALRHATHELDQITDGVHSAVLGMRMQAIGGLFQRFPRIVRDLAHQLDKEVELVLEGADTELDRSLVEALADPLLHLLRNALDHGVARPDERVRVGKPRMGHVYLSARQSSDYVVIAVRDDGRGLDPDLLRRKAVERGFIDDAQASALSESECHELILRPGFTTAAVVSDISGRGVGLDVVKTRVTELSGSVQVRSQLGVGTEIALRLPLTLTTSRVLLVRAGAQLYALPAADVEEVFALAAPRDAVRDARRTSLRGDRPLPLANLSAWADADLAAGNNVVVMRVGNLRLGCVVDDVLAREEVIVKPLGRLFGDVPGIAGVTITADGPLALLVDAAGLLDHDGELRSPLRMTG